MTRPATTLAAALVALAFAACTGHGAAATSEALIPQEPGRTVGTTWTLIGTGDTHAVPRSARAVMGFTKHAVIKDGRCRTVRLAFTSAGDAVRSPGLGSFTFICGIGGAPVRTRYVRALQRVDPAELESGSLNLTGPDDLRLVFDPRNQAAHDLITDDV